VTGGKVRRSGAVSWVYGVVHDRRAASTIYVDEARGVERNRSFSTLSTVSRPNRKVARGNHPLGLLWLPNL